jgi:glycosyltransferase involved in cell wall biosynthesis
LSLAPAGAPQPRPRPDASRPERAPLRVVYLNEGLPLFGGVKVTLHQANLLTRRGHRVILATTGPPPEWYPLEAEVLSLERLEPALVPEADVVVGTYWSTLAVAAACRCRRAMHFCQGYEGSFNHNREDHAAIETAYRLPLPAMVVAPHLAEMLAQRFGRPARVVPQPLEPFWQPRPHFRRRRRPRRVPRILVASPFEIDWKGVATALEAVRLLRARGVACRLVRLSQWPLCAEEREMLEPDELHHRLRPPEVARLMAGCDLLLAPSWEQEGFGLPALEAMACGVPVVASDISSYRGFAAEAARLVPFDQPRAFAAAAEEILGSPRRWRRMRREGLGVASRFTEERTADAAEEALDWALGMDAADTSSGQPARSTTRSVGCWNPDAGTDGRTSR